MSISKEAELGGGNTHSFKIQSTIQNHEVVSPIDSGSTSRFVSEGLARKLKGIQQSNKLVQVRVANGEILKCAIEFQCCQWEVQGQVFHTTFRVLPLSCYYMILGIYWLEQHSPMNIHWLRKPCHSSTKRAGFVYRALNLMCHNVV